MESLVGAAASLVFAVVTAYACGYGVVTLLLRGEPLDLRLAAMPIAGYTLFSLATMAISGNFGLSVRVSVWIALAVMLALSAAALAGRRRRGAGMAPGASWKLLAAIAAPALVVVLGPTLMQGTELYLGSVNLDYFQSLIYADVLRMKDLPVFGVYPIPEGAHSAYLATRAWPESLQARFGAVMFAFLLKSASGLSSKAALTAAMELFALCVPLSVYFFARAVLGIAPRVAALSGALAGIAAPLTMSYLYVLVGQSSGLPVLPLLIGALYLALTAPDARRIAFCGLLIAGLFWLYAMMLPFALAPMGLLGAWLLFTRRMRIGAGAAVVAGIVLLPAAAWVGMSGHLAAFLHGLAEISGRLAGTVFFVDFLTELFFVYFLGVTTYTFGNSLLFRALGALVPGGAAAWAVAIAASAALLAFVAFAIRAWWRAQADGARRFAAAALVGVYAAVWAYFTFARPYGYSAFKMSVWLQFALVPFIAYGIVHSWRAGGGRRAIAAAAALVYCGANLAGALDYDRLSFGTDRERGYIVNAFGMGGNPDWANLGRDIAAHVSPSQTVGLAFTDALQNDWAAYRLMGVARQSILSHAQLPEDDSFLPDPVTGETSDTSGAKKVVAPLGLDDVRNDFFLLPGRANLNPEIVEQRLPAPVWSNGTFQLQDGRKLRDFLFLGRGFYREGFPGPDRPWWQPPGAARWMREGGEFYLYQAAHPGEPYRIAFTAMVGFGYPSASRTLEFWHDGRKFDEVTVTDVARIVSKPFLADGGIDRVTVVIRERTRPFPRPLGLWNRGVPEDTRNLNLYVSSVALLAPGEALPPGGRPRRLEGPKAILGEARLFNGLSAGGWVNAAASLSLVAPFDHGRLALDVMVPGNLGFAFPYRIAIDVNGREHEYLARAPGAQHIVLDLPQAKAGDAVHVGIRPAAHRRIPGAFSDANRPVEQSVLLQSVEFQPAG